MLNTIPLYLTWKILKFMEQNLGKNMEIGICPYIPQLQGITRISIIVMTLPILEGADISFLSS
jgi:hypothetical protein